MNIEAILEEHAHHFLLGIKAELHGDKQALHIIHKYLREGSITLEEDHALKTQLSDTLKIIGIGVPFVLVPGASILMPILIKVADKHNIELMPAAFNRTEEANGNAEGEAE